jgi:hypothetical protein
MSMFFMELISVGFENTKHLINRFILQECSNVVEGVWLWRIKWELLTGDEWVTL